MDRKIKNISLSDKFLPFLENLSEKARSKDRVPFIGRKDVLEAVMETLLRKLKNKLLLVGKPGVGKTALITELASVINSGKVHPTLRGRTVFELSMNRFFFSNESREKFKDDLELLFSELKENSDKIIIFLDEMVIEAFAGVEKDIKKNQITNILKSYFLSRELIIIAATTPDYYYKFINNDDFFSINFSSLFLKEPDEKEMMEILSGISHNFSSYYSLKIGKKELETIYTMAKRFMLHRAFPGKAVELLDISCSKASVKGEKKLKANNIYLTIGEKTRLPVKIVESDPVKQVDGLLKYLKNSVVNQSPAIEELVRVIKLSRMEIENGSRNSGSVFLFLGPPGVGKSFTAGKISEYLFGGKEKLRTIDLREYGSPEDISRFVVDKEGNMGSLVKELEFNPFSLILFENIEFAHPSVLSFLVKTIKFGEIIDEKGKKYYFLHNIFIFSLTRIGEKIFENRIGFIKAGKESGELIIPSKIMNLLENVDEIIEFAPIDEVGLKKIVEKEINALKADMEEMFPCKLNFDKNIFEVLAHQSAVSGGSAHKMNEFIEREIRGRLLSILSAKKRKKCSLKIFFKDNMLNIEAINGK